MNYDRGFFFLSSRKSQWQFLPKKKKHNFLIEINSVRRSNDSNILVCKSHELV